jgi:histidine triad (HIT) family protein
MNDCIFCKIVAGHAPATKLYQDDLVTAFLDIHPVAPTHVLIVPNRHLVSVNDVSVDDERLLGHLFSIARQIAIQEGIEASGYRLIINTGPDSGQAVFHLHMHVIGGQRMRYPMG